LAIVLQYYRMRRAVVVDEVALHYVAEREAGEQVAS
jgi:hypothetical protein